MSLDEVDFQIFRFKYSAQSAIFLDTKFLLDEQIVIQKALATELYGALVTLFPKPGSHSLSSYLTFNYCNTLYTGLPLKTTQKLQWIQNEVTWILIVISWYVHLTPLIWDELHGLSVCLLVQSKMLVMTYTWHSAWF